MLEEKVKEVEAVVKRDQNRESGVVSGATIRIVEDQGDEEGDGEDNSDDTSGGDDGGGGGGLGDAGVAGSWRVKRASTWDAAKELEDESTGSSDTNLHPPSQSHDHDRAKDAVEERKDAGNDMQSGKGKGG